MRRYITFVLFFLATVTRAQPIHLDMQVFAERRDAFMRQLPPNSIAIFPCKPTYQRNLDVVYEYRQESTFYYLSGFEEPEAVLLLNPSSPQHKFIMFVRKRDLQRETYDGPRAGIEGAMQTFGADTAYFFDDFRTHLYRYAKPDGTLYYTFGINPYLDDIIQKQVIERRAAGNWAISDPSAILAEMRLIKNDGDMRMGMRKAVEISALAHREAIKSVEPGMNECEIQAVFEYVYRRHGSPRNGYPCIVGSGPNSTILHYNANNRTMHAGDVLLMDCAAEYGYYSADITRTVPVSGKFSPQQREIYQLVLDAQNAAMRIVKPGLIKKTMDDVIDSVLGTGLVRLGFIKNKNDHRIFTLHGYSHWIGLEVHDVGNYTIDGKSRPLVAGMCFTIEPGVYVRSDVFEKMKGIGYSEQDIAQIRKRVEPYMHIGVRIEDDILVTENGYINMSASVPREIDQIEQLMSEKGIGNQR
ncbi:MAG: Xaa-Pro aminopeptidase [Ignavibacteria bacterium]